MFFRIALCERISGRNDPVSTSEKSEYYLVRRKAVPEVLLKVVEAKNMLESHRVASVQDAVDAVGISRSSFYKYKDDIDLFHDSTKGTTITLNFEMEDTPGLLSDVLATVARFGANILTIHQSIPTGGMAALSLSVQVLPTTGDVSDMIRTMESQKGVYKVRIMGKES